MLYNVEREGLVNLLLIKRKKMAQFRIKTSKNEVLCPSEMEKHEKKSLFDKCKDEKLKLFCNCNGVCEYKVRNGN